MQVFSDFTFSTHEVEVAVDEETGKVEILKLISCFDVGGATNRLSVEGQLEGGAIYGIGYGLTEEVILERGITKTPFLFRVSLTYFHGCARGPDHSH